MGLRQELVCCVSRHTAHPHAHNTCAPVSRCLRSLAYEPLAVPHRVAGLKNPVIPDTLRAIQGLGTQPNVIDGPKAGIPDLIRDPAAFVARVSEAHPGNQRTNEPTN